MKKLAFVLALMMVSGLSYAKKEEAKETVAAPAAEAKKEEKKADDKAAAPAEAAKEEKKADDKAAAPAEAKKVAVRTPTGNVDKFWENLNWSDLSDEEKKLWGALGWDEKSWGSEDNSKIPASENTEWDKLKKEEQETAAKLGYDKKSWDAE